MVNVLKKNGDIEIFNRQKLKSSIEKACKSVQDIDEFAIQTFPELVTRQVENYLENSKISEITTKDLGLEVQGILYNKVSRCVGQNYTIYQYEQDKLGSLNPIKITEDYLGNIDWRINENASISYSIGGYILGNSGAITANYWLNKIYTKEIAEAHKSCKMHIHDLSMLSSYCFGNDLQDLIKRGITGPDTKTASAPAKHFSTLCNQIVNYLGIMSLEFSGAQAFSSVDTLCAPFIKSDKLSYDEVKQEVQSLLFGLNTPSRWGGQPVFSNFTLDLVPTKDLRDKKAIVGGVEQDFTYGDCQEEMDMFNKAFLELLEGGDSNSRGFQYPIPTYNVTKDFPWDNPNTELLFKITAKYGTPYFTNYINSDIDPSEARSMCCRLRLDLRELWRKGGGLFGANSQTGSIGVVTINMPQLGYLNKGNKEQFYNELNRLMILARDSLETKRSVIKKLVDKGFFPYIKHYVNSFDTCFSTIGLNGMHECILNFTDGKYGINCKEGQEFAIEVLTYMRNRLADFQEETGSLFNLEATPAEGTSYRLAMHDKKNFPEIITSGTDAAPYYTNSTWLPVDATSDIFEMLDHQEPLQTLYTGGTVAHILLGESVSDWTSVKELVKTVFTNYKIPYITISPTYSICPIHGYLSGEQHHCPKCKAEKQKKLEEEIAAIERNIKDIEIEDNR